MVVRRATAILFGALLLGKTYSQGIDLDLDDDESIKKAASTAAHGLLTYYSGNETGDVPGNLPAPYYWWEAGAMMGSLVDYWYFTGDDQYVDLTKQALLWQAGEEEDYMPENQTHTMGNDDQGFWAISALQAAEYGFPDPPADSPSWVALTQAVFNEQAHRWNTQRCGGGLRWQVFNFLNGWTYKNTISNGCFFNMAARLGRYTGNDTYLDWANRVFDWMETVSLMQDNYHFHDGADMENNCTKPNPAQFSYNAGIFLYGSAVMWNVTGEEKWRTRTQKIMDAAFTQFFKDDPKDVMYEWICESAGSCNLDQRSFKAYVSRWMGATMKVAPWTEPSISPKLKASATYAAMQCSGTGDYPHMCGLRWSEGSNFDGSTGVGEQMAALEIFQNQLNHLVSGPLTPKTGATSQGDATAGNPDSDTIDMLAPITTGDKFGAALLTILVIGGWMGGAWWMVK